MDKLRIFAALMLCLAVVVVPTASAAPVNPGCLGQYKEDAQGKWATCWGVHYNSQGDIDCIGQWANTEATGDKCAGV